MLKISAENRKFFKTTLLLALPIFMQEIVNSSINLIDSLMVGQLGLEAINAVGLANKLFFLYYMFTFGITSGASVFIGQYYGRGDVKNVRKSMGVCFVTAMLTSLAFGSVAIFAPQLIMGILSENDKVIELGCEYLRVVGISYIVSSVTITFNFALRATRQTHIPMFTSLVSLFTNGILNYVFMFIFGWGVAGAAAATVIARCVELVAQIAIIYGFRLDVAGRMREFMSADRAFVKGFFKVTLPVMLNETMWGVGTFMYDVAYKYCGDSAQGALQISGTVQSMFNVFGMGVGSACGIILANHLGAGEKETAMKYSRKSLVFATTLSAIMGLLLICSSSLILSFYDVDETVKALVRRLLMVIGVGIVVKTYNYTAIVGILRSGGDTVFCLVVDALCVWAVGVPMAFMGAAVLGAPVYIVQIMVYGEEIVKFILASKRVFSNKWVETISAD